MRGGFSADFRHVIFQAGRGYPYVCTNRRVFAPVCSVWDLDKRFQREDEFCSVFLPRLDDPGATPNSRFLHLAPLEVTNLRRKLFQSRGQLATCCSKCLANRNVPMVLAHTGRRGGCAVMADATDFSVRQFVGFCVGVGVMPAPEAHAFMSRGAENRGRLWFLNTTVFLQVRNNVGIPRSSWCVVCYSDRICYGRLTVYLLVPLSKVSRSTNYKHISVNFVMRRRYQAQRQIPSQHRPLHTSTAHCTIFAAINAGVSVVPVVTATWKLAGAHELSGFGVGLNHRRACLLLATSEDNVVTLCRHAFFWPVQACLRTSRGECHLGGRSRYFSGFCLRSLPRLLFGLTPGVGQIAARAKP